MRNVVLCAVAVAGALAAPGAADARPGGAGVVAGVAGLFAGAVVAQLDHLLALFRPLPASVRAGATDPGHRSA